MNVHSALNQVCFALVSSRAARGGRAAPQMWALTGHAKSIIAGRTMECLDPDSGWKTPAIRHGAGGVLSQKLSTKNGIIRPAIVFLAWIKHFAIIHFPIFLKQSP